MTDEAEFTAQLTWCIIGYRADRPQWMVLRHSRLQIDVGKQRSSMFVRALITISTSTKS
jgi:hypothetical protein